MADAPAVLLPHGYPCSSFAYRHLLPLLGEREFGLASKTAALSFIATFGVVKALTNLLAGHLGDRYGRKHVLVAGWLFALPVPYTYDLGPVSAALLPADGGHPYAPPPGFARPYSGQVAFERAHEAWRKYTTLIGPVATFGYWIGWSVVLSVNGLFVGSIIQSTWFSGEPGGSYLAAEGYFSVFGLTADSSTGIVIAGVAVVIVAHRLAVY